MQKNRLTIIYGNKPMEMAYEIMSASNVKALLRKDMKIALKPNLVVSKPASSGATTSPELVEGIIKYLKDNGFNNISIMESSWVGDDTKRAYKVCGYERISSKYNVPLIDLKSDKTESVTCGGMDMLICSAPLHADFLINIPVLKAHCQTSLTCALKNLKGCIPDPEKRRFHALGLHKPIALLNKLLKSHLIIVDGIMGDLTFEEGGNPVRMNRVILGTDPVLVDTYAAQLLGYSPQDIPYIAEACKMGVGTTHIDGSSIIELNKDSSIIDMVPLTRKVSRLAGCITQEQACSACYGSLIHALNRLDENGTLNRLKEKIHIGQGFKGIQRNGIGVGICTQEFSKCLKGCPPKAREIVEFLTSSTT